MSEPKFTKGPLGFHESMRDGSFKICAPSQIPTLTGLQIGSADRNQDAFLWTAAPEMYEALEKALVCHEIRCDMAEKMGLTPPTKESWVSEAKAALAKATGVK